MPLSRMYDKICAWCTGWIASTLFTSTINRVFNDQVDAISKFNLFPVEHYWQSNLTGYRESTLSQFMSQAGLIGALQQARSQHGMYVHRGRHNRPRNIVDPNGLEEGRSCSHEDGISQIGRFTP